MSRLLRRSFTTSSPHLASSPGPSTLYPSAPSSTRTLPLAVARRRRLFAPHPRSSPSPLSDPSFHGVEKTSKRLPLKMEMAFQECRAEGQFKGNETLARAAFLKAEQMWRSRIRGYAWKKSQMIDKVERELAAEQGVEYSPPKNRTAAVKEDEERELDLSPEEVAALADSQEKGIESRGRLTKIVAHRIYLPNIQIRLMRNFSAPDTPYDPYVATFRIPPSMTKTDLRSYLKAVYDLDITFIRTTLHWGEVFRDPKDTRVKRRQGSVNNYKKAIVGLYEPFHYPDDVEELYAMGNAMGAGDRFAKDWEDQLDKAFRLKDNEMLRKRALMKIYKRTRKYRSETSNAGSTIRTIMARRKEREAEMYRVAKDIRDGRLQKAMSAVSV